MNASRCWETLVTWHAGSEGHYGYGGDWILQVYGAAEVAGYVAEDGGQEANG